MNTTTPTHKRESEEAKRRREEAVKDIEAEIERHSVRFEIALDEDYAYYLKEDAERFGQTPEQLAGNLLESFIAENHPELEEALGEMPKRQIRALGTLA